MIYPRHTTLEPRHTTYRETIAPPPREPIANIDSVLVLKVCNVDAICGTVIYIILDKAGSSLVIFFENGTGRVDEMQLFAIASGPR